MPTAPLWFAVPVAAAHEEAAARRLGRALGDAAECFPVRREVMRREAGVWSMPVQYAYPGYVFLATQDLQSTVECLAAAGNAAPLTPIDPKAAALIDSLAGEERVIRMSRGNIVNGHLSIHEGPLKYHTHLIKKIDRHKRAAYFDLALLGESFLRVGLEVVSKT